MSQHHDPVARLRLQGAARGAIGLALAEDEEGLQALIASQADLPAFTLELARAAQWLVALSTVRFVGGVPQWDDYSQVHAKALRLARDKADELAHFEAYPDELEAVDHE